MKGKIKNMEWNFQPETGSLTVRGRGAMEDWGEWKERPWEDFREAIHSVMLASGITDIGIGGSRTGGYGGTAGSIQLPRL